MVIGTIQPLMSEARFSEFMALSRSLREVRRKIIVTPGRLENDLEHTGALCIAGLYWWAHNPHLDLGRLLGILASHELVETICGDVAINDEEGRIDKERREREALEELEQQFPECQIVWDFARAYINQERDDLEAHDAAFIDKVQPNDEIIASGGLSWQEYATNVPFQERRQVQRTRDSENGHPVMVQGLKRGAPIIEAINARRAEEVTATHEPYAELERAGQLALFREPADHNHRQLKLVPTSGSPEGGTALAA